MERRSERAARAGRERNETTRTDPDMLHLRGNHTDSAAPRFAAPADLLLRAWADGGMLRTPREEDRAMPRRAKLTKTRTGVVPASGGWFVAHALRALPRAHEARVHRRGPRPVRDPDGGSEATRLEGHLSGEPSCATARGRGREAGHVRAG